MAVSAAAAVRAAVAVAAAAALGAAAGARAHPAPPPPRPTFEPCPEVACKGKDELAAMFGAAPTPRLRRVGAGAPSGGGNSNSGGAGGGGGDGSATRPAGGGAAGGAAGAAAPPPDCPPNREELGYHTWNLVRGLRCGFPCAASACASPFCAGRPVSLPTDG